MAALCLLALALRVYRISAQSIWWDEAYSVHLARLDLRTAIQITSRDIHPPLYYVLFHYWGAVAGFGEASARLLSAVFSVALVVAVWVAAEQMFDRRTALIAATITALSPLQVIYAQEARMYTLLAFEYALLLSLAWRILRADDRATRGAWLGLVVVQAAALYTHYLAALAIVALNVIALALFVLRGHIRRLGGWIAAQALTLALFAPWLAIAWRQTTGYKTLQQAAPPLGRLLAVTWQFLVSGLYDMGLDDPLLVALSVAASALLWLGVCVLLARRRARLADAYVVAMFAVPLALVVALWQVNPAVHPRYTILFSAPLYLITARVLASWRETGRAGAPLAILLGVSLLGASGVGLVRGLLTDEYAKDDVRAVAAHVQEAGADDLIIVDGTDYSLSYYYRGPAQILMGEESRFEPAQQGVQAALAGKRRAFWVHRFGASDYNGLYPFLLESAGRLVAQAQFRGYVVQTYELDAAPAPAAWQPAAARFPPLELTGVSMEALAPQGGALCVGLHWRLGSATAGGDYGASVVLLDDRGHEWSQADLPLLDANGRGTSAWAPGDESRTLAVLPVPAGAPPRAYRVVLRAYDRQTLRGLDRVAENGAPLGQELPLGEVTVVRGSGNDPYGTAARLELTPVEQSLGPTLRLLGYRVGPPTLAPGQSVAVWLRWQALADAPALAEARLRVVRSATANGDAIGACDAVAPRGYGPEQWQAGEVVVERYDVPLQVTAGQGAARVVLEANGQAVELGVVNVEGVGAADGAAGGDPPRGRGVVRDGRRVARLCGRAGPGNDGERRAGPERGRRAGGERQPGDGAAGGRGVRADALLAGGRRRSCDRRIRRVHPPTQRARRGHCAARRRTGRRAPPSDRLVARRVGGRRAPPDVPRRAVHRRRATRGGPVRPGDDAAVDARRRRRPRRARPADYHRALAACGRQAR